MDGCKTGEQVHGTHGHLEIWGQGQKGHNSGTQEGRGAILTLGACAGDPWKGRSTLSLGLRVLLIGDLDIKEQTSRTKLRY